MVHIKLEKYANWSNCIIVLCIIPQNSSLGVKMSIVHSLRSKYPLFCRWCTYNKLLKHFSVLQTDREQREKGRREVWGRRPIHVTSYRSLFVFSQGIEKEMLNLFLSTITCHNCIVRQELSFLMSNALKPRFGKNDQGKKDKPPTDKRPQEMSWPV